MYLSGNNESILSDTFLIATATNTATLGREFIRYQGVKVRNRKKTANWRNDKIKERKQKIIENTLSLNDKFPLTEFIQS